MAPVLEDEDEDEEAAGEVEVEFPEDELVLEGAVKWVVWKRVWRSGEPQFAGSRELLIG